MRRGGTRNNIRILLLDHHQLSPMLYKAKPALPPGDASDQIPIHETTAETMRRTVPSLNARLACYQTSERKMHSRSSYAPVILPYLRRLLLQMPKTSADVLHRVLAMFQASARGKHSRSSSAPIILPCLRRLLLRRLVRISFAECYQFFPEPPANKATYALHNCFMMIPGRTMMPANGMSWGSHI